MLETIAGGNCTTPIGFAAGVTFCGLKKPGEGKLDLGLLYSEAPCVAAGVFTTNKVKAAPVLLCEEHIAASPTARAVIINSGIANACTGPRGIEDARAMARLASARLGVIPQEVFVASTGLIGAYIPIDRIEQGVNAITLSPDNGERLVRAIMTTDTRPKHMAVRFTVGGKSVTVGGMAKGAGMIHPNMATMLAFVTTDACVSRPFMQSAVREAADTSFNLITVDGDTSTNDTLLALANGMAGNAEIATGAEGAADFIAALKLICGHLAREIARDGEGATKLIEVTVTDAESDADAARVARTVAGSNLVKSAVYGNDPNWGRILAAAGRAGAKLDQFRVAVSINGMRLVENGCATDFDEAEASKKLDCAEVSIEVDLGLGGGRAVAYGCDLTEEYVTFNSAYTT